VPETSKIILKTKIIVLYFAFQKNLHDRINRNQVLHKDGSAK